MDTLTITAFILASILLALVVLLTVHIFRIKQRYAPILDIDAEAARMADELKRKTTELEALSERSVKEKSRLQAEYDAAKNVYVRLQSEISLLEERLQDISFGLYKPHYEFDDPERYKLELDGIYESKKKLIRGGVAVICPEGWTVNGSTREGTKMIKQESKLMLRAFNAEVDASVAKVRWNNVLKMEERIKKAFKDINELGSVMQIRINQEYLATCLSELQLTYEHEAKKQEIKEEQRKIREQMREEELAQREFERAKKEAEAEEAKYQKSLLAARAEIEKAKANELEAIYNKIKILEGKLGDAQSKLERAVSMAQLTKSGHVYIISNIGSFGDDVYKIGMTRRLDPTERVDELGSASVPFPYDIHAMIYTKDAPTLEQSFHKQFFDRRVNQVNTRKEFFRITLDELRQFALTHDATIEFTELAEAREYRQTIAKLNEALSNQPTLEETSATFPSSLFN